MGNKKGGSDPQQIDPAKMYSDIFNIFQQKVAPGYEKWAAGQPLIQGVKSLAQQGINQLPALQNLLTGAYQRFTPISQLTGPVMAALNAPGGAAQTAASGGALTPQLGRLADQQSLSLAARGGMAHTLPAFGAALLNRDLYRQNRYGQAVNQLLQLTSQVPGLEQQDFSRTLGYAMGQQGLRGSAMQDAAAAEQGGINAFGALFNPTAAGVGSALNFNANAKAAADNAQSQKKGNTTGATIGAVGTIAAAFL